MRNLTNHLYVHVQECIEMNHITASGIHSQLLSCTSNDLVLIEHTPQKISKGWSMNWDVPSMNRDAPILLEFSPGIPSEHSQDYYPGEDGLTRVCISRWLSPTSQPYCSYECYAYPNVTYITQLESCDEFHNCTMEVRRLLLTPNLNPVITITDNTYGNPHRNITDNSSDGYSLSFFYLEIYSSFDYCEFMGQLNVRNIEKKREICNEF